VYIVVAGRFVQLASTIIEPNNKANARFLLTCAPFLIVAPLPPATTPFEQMNGRFSTM
jgi:hypothetical protein